MGFNDISELIDGRLIFPGILGADGEKRTYVVPPANAKVGLWAQRMFTLGYKIMNGGADQSEAPKLLLDDHEEADLYTELLGEAYQQMIDDGVPWEMVKNIGNTALICAGANRELAEQFWNGGCDPNSVARHNRAARRQATKATPTRSTGAASTTKQRASSSGTTSRPASSRARGKAGQAGS